MLDPKNISHQIRFRGVTNDSRVSNKQQGPTCGFEAVANIIELCRPEYAGTDLVSTDLFRRAQSYNAVDQQGALAVWAYQRILEDYSIVAYWYPYDNYQVILPALQNNQGVLVIGDAYFLNPAAYKQSGSHTFVLTNYYTEESGYYIIGYTGIDSNFSFQNRAGQFKEGENFWPTLSIENAVRNVVQLYPYPVLITAGQVNWPYGTARYYRVNSSGAFLPVPY